VFPASFAAFAESGAERPGPFVVIGMGRSGTSYVASILHRSGYDMGKRMKPADDQNEAGYYEDLEATLIHEKWLAELGYDFGTVSDRFPLPVTPSMIEDVESFVEQRETHRRPWGVKPPGALFFWPAWRAALPRSTVLAVPFRHPEAVVGSYLAAGDTRERAEALWLQLNRLALAAIDAGPFAHVVLDFDRPRHVGARLAEILQAPVVDTYRADLHHHQQREALGGELGTVYRELRARAGG
jgi:hypothetical protein